MPAIEEACRDAGIGPSDLARVAVSVGPGGFTALRIAVTTAKMLALTRSCACIAVPTAAALALRCPESHFQRGPVAIALAWKRDTVWIERFESPTRCLSSRLEHTDRLDLTGCSALIADPRFVDALGATLRHASLAIQHPQFDAAAVLEASMTIEPTDPLALAPFYPREPEAVTKWRELHG